MLSTVLPRHIRWRSLFVLALVLGSLLWPLKLLAERYYLERLIEQHRQTLDLYVANLLGTLHRFEVLPEVLVRLPEFADVLKTPDQAATRAAANALLKRIEQQSKADVIYLLDARGTTLVASNWDEHDSFIGRNFAFRPYFRQAMQGQLGRFFGLGTTSGKRGYFYAYALREGEQILGVLAVKVDLDATEVLWGKGPEQLLVTDEMGVVILSSRDDWRFHATRSLSRVEQELIAANRPYGTPSPPSLRLQDNQWLTQARALKEVGWTVSILAPQRLLTTAVREVMLVGAAMLLALLLLLAVLIQRRRHYLERQNQDARARRELEIRVLDRTAALESLNTRLRAEVHEREQTQQALVQAQDELIQAGKLSALGTMSASISHELNQPLGAMRSYADNALLLLQQQRSEAVRDNLEQISQLTQRMARIIAHLKAYARRESPKPEPVELDLALEDSLALLERRLAKLGITVQRDVPRGPHWVLAGDTRLRQILSNLLGNAVDALSEQAGERRLCLRLQVQGEYVRLVLRDSGAGFSPEALQHAREPFFTTKARTEGLGLGLAICDTLVRAVGGELSLANHPDGGAVVTLQLHACNATSAASSPQQQLQ
ncbi:sensor histidine kinase [Atopomonas sediminilitoris]|uniref:sensor histidine kinase n=1 Tax=Atopomonas sediminilitoris TaxID=2919919 RepID=UPI001F4E0A6B|nr:ATP-binding protein [Atopomonas sediminilitoris]MCJ8168287.1 ATP-binding protein [Atopomonas sediminilitoris]